MEGMCGADCSKCELFNRRCNGCKNTNGCPFGHKCWVASYIEIGGKEGFDEFKKQIMKEFNSLKIDGMPEIDELYQLRGDFVNLEYTLPNGNKVKFLDDNEIYLGNQIELDFEDEKICFGLLANMDFLLVCEYGENGTNPEIIIYRKR